MKTAYKVLTLITLATALVACKKSENRGETTISVLTDLIETRADGDEVDAALQPMFLFWTAGNFGDATKQAPNFFTRVADGVIDDYKTTKYNTKVYYPLYNEVVYANGVAPAPGSDYVSFKTANNYNQFVINETPVEKPELYDVRGMTDPLVATATISGTDEAPLGKLMFKHATTRLELRAQLAPTMTKFVDHVQVFIPGTSAAMTLDWNATTQTYEVKGGGEDDGYWSGTFWSLDGIHPDEAGTPYRNETMYYQLSRENDLRAGITHIVPPGNSITVNIRYRQSDTSENFEANCREVNVENFVINFKDGSDNPVTLGAGDSYRIILFFDNYDIELIGKKVAWEDGGFVSLPFQIR